MSDASLSAELGALESFFGVPLNRVDQKILSLARLQRRPDWLRGKRKRNDLPRHQQHFRFDASHTPNCVPLERTPIEQEVARVAWVVENLRGPWAWGKDRLWFSEDTDLVHYRLMFPTDED